MNSSLWVSGTFFSMSLTEFETAGVSVVTYHEHRFFFQLQVLLFVWLVTVSASELFVHEFPAGLQASQSGVYH